LHRLPVRSKKQTRRRARAGRGRGRRDFGLEGFARRIDCEIKVACSGRNREAVMP